MVFKLENVSKINLIHTKFNARTFVLLCTKSTTDKILDNYLIKNYKLPLVAACLRIIDKASYNLNSDGDLLITFTDKKIDKLASLITFGTGKVQGSNILKLAFGQK